MERVRELWPHKSIEGPVEVRLQFYCGRPKSHMYTGRNAHIVKPTAPAAPRKDVDNLAKLVLDGLSGRAYRDDDQVVALTATKAFGTPPRTEIEVVPATTLGGTA